MSRWLIERGGIQITITAKSTAAEELVLAAIGTMQPQRVKISQGIKLSVNTEDEHWLLRDRAKDVTRKLKTSGDLIYHLTDSIVFHIADKSDSTYCLHAAAVSDGEHAMIIPANSGAGKSTFTTWLVANGFSYITDELILVDQEHRITGVARPIQIKAHGLDAIKPLLVDPTLVFAGNLANAVTPSALGGEVSDQSSHHLAMMVFPKYEKGSDFKLSPISGAEAGMSLMGNYVNARNLEGHGFREMMAVIRKTPCYLLEYGGFDTLPADFKQQLTAMLSADSSTT